MKQVTLPELGEGIENANITFWYFKVGDLIKEKDDLVELATDKATFNLPSPSNGKLARILLKEGESAKIGAVLAEIDDTAT